MSVLRRWEGRLVVVYELVMDISRFIETKAPFAFIRFFSRFFLKSFSSQALLWVFLPFFFLCLTLGASVLRPSFFSSYFPFVALIGVLASVIWKTRGLAAV